MKCLPIQQNGPIESEEVELSRKTSHAAEESRREQEEEQDIEGSADQEQEQTTSMPTSEPKRERRALLTRSNIYHILMDKFQRCL